MKQILKKIFYYFKTMFKMIIQTKQMFIMKPLTYLS